MELGSEFHLDLSQLKKTEDTVFQYLKEYQTIYTDSGRSALRLLSPYLEGKTILIPEYICDSVIEAFPENVEIVVYPVDKSLIVDIETVEKLLEEKNAHWVYLMHYFGKLQPKEVLADLQRLKERYGFKIIEDTTHSLFSARKTVGDYCVASLRKWFPIPDGGVLYSSPNMEMPALPMFKKPASKKVEAMLLKNLYLSGEFDCNEKYRELFVKEEGLFDEQEEIYEMSDIAEFLLNFYSVQELCRKRKENVVCISELLKNMCYEKVLEFETTEVPFVLPIYVEHRDEFRKYLIEHNVFCAIHWPLSKKDVKYNLTDWIEKHILSLPIDQRYDAQHMEYLINCLSEYRKERSEI